MPYLPQINSLAATLVWVAASTASWAQSSVPNPVTTPGALNPAVTEETKETTICASGWTRTVRPPSSYTSHIKRAQLRAAGYADQAMRDYEEDHLVPLTLGGAPDDPRNLWPEPRQPADGWTSDLKDELEVALNGLVCSGRLPLAAAQWEIAQDWRRAYVHHLGR